MASATSPRTNSGSAREAVAVVVAEEAVEVVDVAAALPAAAPQGTLSSSEAHFIPLL